MLKCNLTLDRNQLIVFVGSLILLCHMSCFLFPFCALWKLKCDMHTSKLSLWNQKVALNVKSLNFGRIARLTSCKQ